MESLGTLLKGMVVDFGLSQKVNESQVLLVWEKVVGVQLAGQARPLRICRGRLEVAVPSAAWRTHLSFCKQDLIARLNAQVGQEVVKDLILLNQR